ncbi:MAG: bacteriohemerythrin [Deltaproteobacteria bacterium]|nr:bacteriohemerythrin [Deltaproteobacteria bacterium]
MAVLWRNDLSIGVELIDNQHKELFVRINNLLDACTQGKGAEEVGSVIKFLEDYVVTHFTDEVGLMTKHRYPEIEGHKALHDQFIQGFNKLKDQFEKEGATINFVIQVNQVVVDWLVNHISRVDKKLGAFLKDKM